MTDQNPGRSSQNATVGDLQQHPSRRILRPKKQCKVLDVSLATLYRFAKSPDFPKNVQLGENSVGRFEDELVAWLVSRQEA